MVFLQLPYCRSFIEPQGQVVRFSVDSREQPAPGVVLTAMPLVPPAPAPPALGVVTGGSMYEGDFTHEYLRMQEKGFWALVDLLYQGLTALPEVLPDAPAPLTHLYMLRALLHVDHVMGQASSTAMQDATWDPGDITLVPRGPWSKHGGVTVDPPDDGALAGYLEEHLKLSELPSGKHPGPNKDYFLVLAQPNAYAPPAADAVSLGLFKVHWSGPYSETRCGFAWEDAMNAGWAMGICVQAKPKQP